MRLVIYTIQILLLMQLSYAQQASHSNFNVIGFYSAKNDLAHISFVHEANRWFNDMAKQYGFVYDSTSDWNKLNATFLQKYRVVLFLDTRPDSVAQREAFRKYMENGGRWMGFHFAAFALTPSAYPQNWDWYHNDFIGAGEYRSNTWRPTAAVLKTENKHHPAVKNLPDTFTSAPCEWYKWTNNISSNNNIRILLSIDSASFPLGTGPKQHEIWHNGYYPIAWSNEKYKMIYMNMGHDDIDYEGKTNAKLSSSFSSRYQNRFIIDGLLWLGNSQ